jgi:hypothetical protein
VPGLSGGSANIHAGGTLTLENAILEFENEVSITADEKLRLLTILQRVFTPNGYHDVLVGKTSVTSKKGKVTAIGKTGFEMKGSALKAMLNLIAGSTHGNTEIANILLQSQENHTTVEDEGFCGGKKTTHTQSNNTRNQPCDLESQSQNTMVISAKDGKSSITGSKLKAFLAIIFQGGKVETNAAVGLNTTSTNSETSGTFSSVTSTSSTQSADFYATLLEARAICTNTNKAIYRGTNFIADILFDNTDDGAELGPTIAMLEYFQQTVSESAFAKSDVGIKGGYETMERCHVMVNKVIRTMKEGEIKFNSVIWDRDKTQIIGKLAETTYQLKQWQASWNHS